MSRYTSKVLIGLLIIAVLFSTINIGQIHIARANPLAIIYGATALVEVAVYSKKVSHGLRVIQGGKAAKQAITKATIVNLQRKNPTAYNNFVTSLSTARRTIKPGYAKVKIDRSVAAAIVIAAHEVYQNVWGYRRVELYTEEMFEGSVLKMPQDVPFKQLWHVRIKDENLEIVSSGYPYYVNYSATLEPSPGYKIKVGNTYYDEYTVTYNNLAVNNQGIYIENYGLLNKNNGGLISVGFYSLSGTNISVEPDPEIEQQQNYVNTLMQQLPRTDYELPLEIEEPSEDWEIIIPIPEEVPDLWEAIEEAETEIADPESVPYEEEEPGENPDPGENPGENPDPGENPGENPDPGQNPSPWSPPIYEPPPQPGENPNPSPEPNPNPDPLPDPANPFDPEIPPPAEGINWDKLKGIPTLITTKFPFSLPWDIYHILSLFSYQGQPLQFQINEEVNGMPFAFEIDLSWLDPYMPYFRWFILIGYAIFLIMSTRKLMGGSV